MSNKGHLKNNPIQNVNESVKTDISDNKSFITKDGKSSDGICGSDGKILKFINFFKGCFNKEEEKDVIKESNVVMDDLPKVQRYLYNKLEEIN